ncbi:kinase-like protein [Rickenella mellea]|uniref:non-specific serine/threonine protein kinase n=1 Tax=Rickenella mellea TaxID=50990 RepID=A0A4Y7Q7V2_9AGAM|nr:kinase-like protein [Rickenella mellea]
MSKLLLITAIRNTLSKTYNNSHARTSSNLSVIVHRKNYTEPQHRYEPGGYHLVLPNEFYDRRYQVVRKLGSGRYSTVWLVQDTNDQSLAAMKVLVGDLSISDKKGGWDELGILKVIRDKNPQSFGYRHVCQLLDDFTHEGPNGNHICLVLEAMNLSVLDIYRSIPGAMAIPLLKRISKHVLLALQYLHEECDIIHTDIKGDNILMTGTPPEEGQLEIELKDSYLKSTTFKLSDFGAANAMANRFAEVIQPESLRSPEVIIGAEWDTKADIWNFGCLIYEFARGAKLFEPHWDNENSGMNPTQTLLSQITGLCGDFSPEFINRGRKSKLYFNDQGSLLRGAGKYTITLEDLLSRAGHSPKEVCETANFLSHMLVTDPKERWSAARLLHHPWLKSVGLHLRYSV